MTHFLMEMRTQELNQFYIQLGEMPRDLEQRVIAEAQKRRAHNGNGHAE